MLPESAFREHQLGLDVRAPLISRTYAIFHPIADRRRLSNGGPTREHGAKHRGDGVWRSEQREERREPAIEDNFRTQEPTMQTADVLISIYPPSNAAQFHNLPYDSLLNSLAD